MSTKPMPWCTICQCYHAKPAGHISTRQIGIMQKALRSAKRVLLDERREQFACFTIAPDRSYEQMNRGERAAIRRFDRAIAKINEALR